MRRRRARAGIPAAAIAAVGPDYEATGPDSEAAGPDSGAAGPDLEAARPDFEVAALDSNSQSGYSVLPSTVSNDPRGNYNQFVASNATR